jgi:hypothetical protein
MTQVEKINVDHLKLPFCSDQDFEQNLDQAGLMTDLVVGSLNHAKEIYSDHCARDSGQPFLNEHIYPVTLDVNSYFSQRGYGPDDRIPIVRAAILHDTFEADPGFENRFYDIDQDVYKIIYDQTKIRAKGNPQIEDIFLRKIEYASENAQVISLYERVNNLYCSIVNGRKMPEKLLRYTEATEADFLPIAALLEDRELYERVEGTIKLSRLAMCQLGIYPPGTKHISY